jgi:UDP-N-acetylmuramyl tripeptide synthase
VLKTSLAVMAGKITAGAIRRLGAGLGSNLPGRMARQVSPAVLQQLSKQAKLGVVAVTGTNGKSTTSGLLSSILRTAGFTLVHNRQGANLVNGITASLVDAANWQGRLNVDYCLFEIDEAALPLIAAEVELSTVLVTNLFRDQLDRFGELDTTARLIASGIAKNKTRAVLNADDPNVSQLAPGSETSFYGIESIHSMSGSTIGDSARLSAAIAASGAVNASVVGEPEDKTQVEISKTGSTPVGNANDRELSNCGKCGSSIDYDLFFYGQLGHWRCTNCDFKRPIPSVVAKNISVHAESSNFDLTIAGTTSNVFVPLPGLFNVYNALAAAATAHQLGVSFEAIRQGLKHYKTLFGRSERIVLSGKPALIQLIKNPAGASQALSALVLDPKARVMIAINDNLADGRDISWLWDADFELLAEHKHEIVVAGTRAEDMAVRVKYAGSSDAQITTIARLDKALDHALEMVQPGETLWILPTYTCLLDLQKILKGRGQHLAGT